MAIDLEEIKMVEDIFKASDNLEALCYNAMVKGLLVTMSLYSDKDVVTGNKYRFTFNIKRIREYTR